MSPMHGPTSNAPIYMGITGASGAPYWRRLLEQLLRAGEEVHLVVSSNVDAVCRFELGRSFEEVLEEVHASAAGRGTLRRFERDDFHAPMASGSARAKAMAIVPCSLGTLGRIASGTSNDLMTRAADVALKERLKLVMLVRDTPLNLIHLENMTRLTRAGAIIMPASPGFYQKPKSIDDLVDFVVQRVCDQLNVDVSLMRRWGEGASSANRDKADEAAAGEGS